jgi:hypothetical protein
MVIAVQQRREPEELQEQLTPVRKEPLVAEWEAE